MQFAYFPAQKVKPCGDFGIVSTPPQFHKETEEMFSLLRSFRPKHIPTQGSVKNLFKQKKVGKRTMCSSQR